MRSVLHSVIETPGFIADAKDAAIDQQGMKEIIDYIAANPDAGDLIKGTGGARKVRFGGRGKGKSGSYRVVTFYGGDDIPVFLLAVFAKGDRVDLSQAERNELRQELKGLAKDYREGARYHVASR